MATKIKHKRSSVPGKVPLVSQLESGELAINTADGKVFLLRDDNTVQDITQRIFQGDSQVIVSDQSDSTHASVEIDVNNDIQMRITGTNAAFYNDVDIENAKHLTFRELTASGNNGVGIKAPDTLAGSYDLTLPPTPGINGQLLRTTSSGQLEFTDADIFGGNVIYVSSTQGVDTNDGINAPVKTLKKALQLASQYVYNADGTTNGTRVNVKVAVGDYTEANPLIVPDNVVVKGDGLRGCIIRPANANQDMLRVRNGSYFAEFTFRDGVDANYVPIRTFDHAVAYDDPYDITVDRTGYTYLPTTRPTITTSPYIQNCSIISFLGGNGVIIDGTKVNSPNVPTIKIEAENPVVGAIPEQGKSMVANAFTMLSFGGTGWRVINDAYAQIVSCFQIFMLNGVYCQSGGYCSITNSATNFGLYALRSSGYSPKSFSFDRAYVTGTGLSSGLQTINIVGINRPQPVEEFIVRFRDPDYKIAYDLLEANKTTIITDTLNWINSQIAAATPGSIWYNFTYDYNTWYGYFGVIVDAVAQDTWGTGNKYSRATGLSFYNKNLADSADLLISTQVQQMIAAIGQANTYALTFVPNISSTAQSFVTSRFTIISDLLGDPTSWPVSTDVSSQGDITNSYAPAPSVTTFDAATAVNPTTNIFTIANHGFTNLQKLIYNSNGNPIIQGLDNEQTYYVVVINSNEFSLTYDDSGTYPVDIISTSTGLHEFLSNVQEFFVDEIISTHNVYQTLTLPSTASTYNFVPGRAITGTTGSSNNAAYVYSWIPETQTLTVSIEYVTVGNSTQQVLFDTTSTITADHSGTPNTNISITAVAARTDLTTASFSILPTDSTSQLINLTSLPEKQIWFHRPSIVNSSAHTWEYAGSGIDYNALPQNGGNTVTKYEQYAELPGRVYTSGTNELGDFKVGDFITAYNRTGNITFKNKVQVDTLDTLKLSLSNIAITQISTDVNLGDSELGGPSNSRLSTQLAIRSFINNRLGGFVDKAVSTAAVPGAIVQLNTNGQLNAELIPATRQFTSTNIDGYLSRILQVDDIPSVDLKAGDISTENYDQQELTFASPISANDGDIVTQAVTGATGYVKGSYANSTYIIVASEGLIFKPGADSTGSDFDTVHTISINGVSTGQAPSALGPTSSVTDNYFLKTSNTSQYLDVSTASNWIYTSAVISSVSRTSNVATINTTTNHNLYVGDNVQVIVPMDTTFNSLGVVLSTPTSTSFTIANVGSDVTSTVYSGNVYSVVTSAESNAQGAVTETRYGVIETVDNANITSGSGYTPSSGTVTYSMVPLTNVSSAGSGAYADITVSAGKVSSVDIRRGGTGYLDGDVLSASAGNLGGTGSGFQISVSSISNRVYVDIIGGVLFVASTSALDYIEDNTAISNKKTITLTSTVSDNFLAGDIGSGGNVDYTNSQIDITNHGFTSGDPVTYNTLGNVAIGGLLNGHVYYVKSINTNVIELYEDYDLVTKVIFLSTPANNNHNLTRYAVNLTDNSIVIPAHGYTTGDAVRIEGSSLPYIAGTQIVSGARYWVGSVTTNSFTLHSLRSDALSSINGLAINVLDITATGSGTADFILSNVQVYGVVNTSSRLKSNWNSLAVTNIDATNIISGTISPSRLASSGTANTETFLRGDSSYQVVVQKLAKSNTTDNPITLTGSSLNNEYYGAVVDIGIANVAYDNLATYSTLGVSRFLQTQFNVATDGSGQVYIKSGVIDAGTLGGLASSYYLNPSNLTSPVPVSKGGTNITTYAVGDLIYASSTGTLATLNIGPANSFLKSNGTTPEWSSTLDTYNGLNVENGIISTTSTSRGQIFDNNITRLDIGGSANRIKIGNSNSNTTDITSLVTTYSATTSTSVTVNLTSFTQTTNFDVTNNSNIIYLGSTSNIKVGMLVTGSASIPANTTVTGVTSTSVYISANTTGTITLGTTLTFTNTPFSVGVNAGDFVVIASSGVTGLDGTWPVTGATTTATSFTFQTSANVTVSGAPAGTVYLGDYLNVPNNIYMNSPYSSSPTNSTINGESGYGVDAVGGNVTINAGAGTGAGTGGQIIFATPQVSSTGATHQTLTNRLTIDNNGKATFTGEVDIASTLSTSASTVNVVNTTATTVNFAGAGTNVNIGAATGNTNINNNAVITGNAAVNGGSLTTTATTFNLANTTATTLNVGGAATTVNIGATSGNTNVKNNLVVDGNLTVAGTTTTVNSATLDVTDKNITIGNVSTPSDVTAEGGGLTLKGTTDKTLDWTSVTGAWTSSENFDLATGKTYKINGTDVLTSNTLGSGILYSSLTSVGTISTGIWNGTIISPTYGGTGVNNGSNTITLAGNLATSGAFGITLTATGTTNVTLPTTGTLAITQNPLSQFASTTSAQLAGVISDETGTGVLVFNNNPTFVSGVSTSSTTFNLFNTTATTVNFAGAGTTVNIGAATGNTNINNNAVITGNAAVNGGNLTTTATTFNLVNATATTVNAFGAATALSLGAGSGNTTVNNNLIVSGNLTVAGTTTTVNSNTLNVYDANITIGDVATPSDITANGGGITLKGVTDKTLNWYSATGAWTSSENFDLASGKTYKINGTDVLSATSLGSGIVSSSLTSVGTLTSGTWNASIINSTYGGTGVNNAGRTITVAGNFATSGAFAVTLTATGATNVTLPTSGTLAITQNPLSQFASTTSAQLAGVISDETGSGNLVFNTNPNFVTGVTTSSATFNVFNTNATTVNAFGAATALSVGAITGTTTVNNNLTVSGTATISGSALNVGSTTFNLANTTATTLNVGGAATTVSIGAATGNTTVNNNLVVSGNLTVTGTTTTINSATLDVTDINIILGNVATPTDTTAEGGGITLKGTTDKTFDWTGLTGSWTSSENIDLASGKTYKINGTDVLSANTLGSGVINSSLTSVGIITTGTWHGSIISPTYGGTGVNNGSSTITLGGSLTTVGAFGITLTATGTTNVTLPTSGTLAITQNPLSQFASTTSAQLAGVISDETGSGNLVFNTSPNFVTSIGTASTSFSLLNQNATTINAFGAATAVNIGAATGSTNIKNSLVVTGNIGIQGDTLNTTSTTFNLVNTTASTVNIAGAGTAISIGAATGNTTVNNNLNITGNAAVNGGSLTTTATTFNLLNSTATTVNFAGGASTVNIGAAASTTTVNNLNVTGTLQTSGSLSFTSLDNTPIGASTPSTGAFTTLTASGLTTFTSTTASTSTTTGAVVISGGLGVGGAIYAANLWGNIDGSQITSGTIPDARISQTAVTQYQSFITGTGTLTSGSIGVGFGNINIGTNTFTGNGSGLTNLNASNLATGTVSGSVLGGNQTMAGIKTFSDTTASTSTITGAVVISGGLGVAGNIWFGGTANGNGSGLTTLNATNLSSGTVNDARLPTSQTGKTFTSDITISGFKFGKGSGDTTNLAVAGGQSVSTGTNNTVFGINALSGIVTGSYNIAVGNGALAANTSTSNNIAIGSNSQTQRTSSGSYNVGVGNNTMTNSTAGNYNAAFGHNALEIVTGSSNVGIGYGAGSTLTSGSNNIIIGYNAAPSSITVSNEITLGTSSHTSLLIPGVNTSVNTTTFTFTGTAGFSGIGTLLTSLNASNLSTGTVPDARISQTSVTQYQSFITGTGTLTSGSIGVGFGNINIGTNIFTGNGSGLTSLNASNLATGTVSGSVLGGNQTMAGIKTFSDTTQSTSTTTGAVVIGGGLGVSSNIYFGGTAFGNGSGLTNLVATNLASGTVPNAVISGTYSNLTGTGALTTGSIGVGFGNINIGTNTFTGNGSGLTNVSAATLGGLTSSQFLRSDIATTNSVSIAAPIFYDSNNTTFFANFADTGNSVYVNGNYALSAVNGNGIRFWNADTYKIYMSAYNDATWGGRLDTTSDYNIYFRMGGGTNRGFVFQNGSTSIAQIDASGNYYTPNYANKSEAATVASTTQTLVASFSTTSYGGGKFIVQIHDTVTGARQISEFLVTHDGTTAVATEYGTVVTAADLATFQVDISAGVVRLLATQLSTNSTTYKVVEQLIAV